MKHTGIHTSVYMKTYKTYVHDTYTHSMHACMHTGGVENAGGRDRDVAVHRGGEPLGGVAEEVRLENLLGVCVCVRKGKGWVGVIVCVYVGGRGGGGSMGMI